MRGQGLPVTAARRGASAAVHPGVQESSTFGTHRRATSSGGANIYNGYTHNNSSANRASNGLESETRAKTTTTNTNNKASVQANNTSFGRAKTPRNRSHLQDTVRNGDISDRRSSQQQQQQQQQEQSDQQSLPFNGYRRLRCDFTSEGFNEDSTYIVNGESTDSKSVKFSNKGNENSKSVNKWNNLNSAGRPKSGYQSSNYVTRPKSAYPTPYERSNSRLTNTHRHSSNHRPVTRADYHTPRRKEEDRTINSSEKNNNYSSDRAYAKSGLTPRNNVRPTPRPRTAGRLQNRNYDTLTQSSYTPSSKAENLREQSDDFYGNNEYDDSYEPNHNIGIERDTNTNERNVYTKRTSKSSGDSSSGSSRRCISINDPPTSLHDNNHNNISYRSSNGSNSSNSNSTNSARRRLLVSARPSNKDNNRNGVSFNLPNEDQESEKSSFYGTNSNSASANHRMSTPELPPIVDNNSKNIDDNRDNNCKDKRKSSNHSVASKTSSLNQLAERVNSKSYFNRKYSVSNTKNSLNSTTSTKKKKLPIPRNHSDSSLKHLVAAVQNSPQNSQGSGSIVSNPQNSKGLLSGAEGGVLERKPPKFLSHGNRALSWCATENSGSQTRLETLFEGKNSLATNFQIGSENGNDPDMRGAPTAGQRSVSVSSMRKGDELPRKGKNFRAQIQSENEDSEIATVDEFATRGRMRRSNSENKLSGKQNSKQKTPRGGNLPPRSLSRNLSVDRLDRLTSNPKSRNNSLTSNNNNNNSINRNLNNVSNNNNNNNYSNNNTSSGATTTKFRLRRVSSVSALNSTNNNNNNNNSKLNRNSISRRGDPAHPPSRGGMQEQDPNNEVFEDWESCEVTARLVEWLNVVNNVDEYEHDPRDSQVEYLDEPPQTDTAIHLVYNGD